jgi:hypothetical protein
MTSIKDESRQKAALQLCGTNCAAGYAADNCLPEG